MNLHNAAVWLISLVSIALVLVRPKGLAEAWWASLGACLLVLFRLMSVGAAADAVAKGLDVYLFLIGMMIMSELARREGVFDWVAGHAVQASRGSQSRLFLLIYLVGTVVTVFLSNDATAVVLTPAVLAAVRAAQAEPLPYLLICAFIANAASFVLPISNPANLVVYGSAMPPLGSWLFTFGIPSLTSIVATFLLLRWLSSKLLVGETKTNVDGKALSPTGRVTLYGIAFLAIALMAASAFNIDLGAPAFAVGILVAGAVSLRDYSVPRAVTKEISWSVLPLVAGLFVIVEAMGRAGALGLATRALTALNHWPTVQAIVASGFGVAIISNLTNNLPTGLISGAAVKAAGAVGPIRDSVLIGVDLGPNLSVTGSLATILWLVAIRREGLHVSFWTFLRYGVLIMPPALALSLLSLLLGSSK
jgi:arsenical pump membrane protein